MAVHASAADYAQWKANLARNQGGRGNRTPPGRGNLKPVTTRPTVRERGKTTLYRAARVTRERAPVAARRAVRGTARQAGRAAATHVTRARGGVGTVFVIATGAGILVMLIRRPALITTPIGFVTGVFRAFTGLTRKVTGH